MIRFFLLLGVGAFAGDVGPADSQRRMETADTTDSLVSYVSTYATPEGQLAAGMELLNANFGDASSQLYEDSSVLHTELAESIDLIARVVSTVLEDEVFQREYRRQLLLQDIQETAVQINDITQSCSQRASCLSCAQDLGCVWCVTMGRCVTGDSFGPLRSECTDFTYRDCPALPCNDYTSCVECLTDASCAWCEGTGECGSADTISCDASFLFVEQRGASCPYQQGDSYSTQSPPNLRDSRLTELQREMVALEAQAASIRDQANVLESALSKVIASQAVAKSLALSADYTFQDLQGLAATVDMRAQEESKHYAVGSMQTAVGTTLRSTVDIVAQKVKEYVSTANEQRAAEVAVSARQQQARSAFNNLQPQADVHPQKH